jgi:hypothetical protein
MRLERRRRDKGGLGALKIITLYSWMIRLGSRIEMKSIIICSYPDQTRPHPYRNRASWIASRGDRSLVRADSLKPWPFRQRRLSMPSLLLSMEKILFLSGLYPSMRGWGRGLVGDLCREGGRIEIAVTGIYIDPFPADIRHHTFSAVEAEECWCLYWGKVKLSW